MDNVDVSLQSLNSPGGGPLGTPVDSILVMFIGVGRSILIVLGTIPLAGNTRPCKVEKVS